MTSSTKRVVRRLLIILGWFVGTILGGALCGLMNILYADGNTAVSALLGGGFGLCFSIMYLILVCDAWNR